MYVFDKLIKVQSYENKLQTRFQAPNLLRTSIDLSNIDIVFSETKFGCKRNEVLEN